MATRTERDTMGEVEVPAERYWGASTARSLANFAIGDEIMPIEVIRALALVKKAVAMANAELGTMSQDLADLIVRAADEIIDGGLDEHFPLSVWQTGSGTQTNMNVNEVIANRAIEITGGVLGSKRPVHPNDHVNLGQSSNDAFPSAMHIAAVAEINEAFIPSLTHLVDLFREKSAAWRGVVKLGRTHLMDAVPLTLGQEAAAWASQIEACIGRVRLAGEGLLCIPIGGTAVGTGLNAHPGLGDRAAAIIADLTGQPFSAEGDRFSGMAAHDAMVHLSACLRTTAVALTKIANDIRLLASGPRGGLSELRLPANEPGSSIMPGKVNPTQAEAMTMVAAQVIGNDSTIAFAGSQGHLQLNAFKPVIIFNLLQSIRLLADAGRSFADRCIAGIEADRTRITEHLESSLMLATALNPHLGYDNAALVARKAYADGTPLKTAAIALGFTDEETFDRWVRPERMVGDDDRDSGHSADPEACDS